MNKYQKELIEDRSQFYIFAEDQDGKLEKAFNDKNVSLSQFNEIITDYNAKFFRESIKLEDTVTLNQIWNIKIRKYFLLLYNRTFENISYKQNGKIKNANSKCEDKYNAFGMTIDFDNPIKNLEIYFILNLADKVNIKLKYIEIDKELYLQEQKEEHNLLLRKTLNANHSCGENLVTIKFANANNNVRLTKISLFDKNKQLMGIFKVEEGMFYKSIADLAFGKYFYKVHQYDENENLIVETDYIEFSLNAPNYGKTIVRCCG